MRPVIGITTDLAAHSNGERVFSYRGYVEAVERGGGVAVLLPPAVGAVGEYACRMDGFVLAGGDDPSLEPFGGVTHEKAVRVHRDRQGFETRLLEELARGRPDAPVLGVCLGMQMMALVSGGELEQHMPDRFATHAQHWEGWHGVEPSEPVGSCGLVLRGEVRSKHRQAVVDAGALSVIARAPDGVIEAIADGGRRFFVGVQWHPERTGDDRVGAAVFRALVRAAGATVEGRSECRHPWS